MVNPGWDSSQPGLSWCFAKYSAKGPVSRILSCAVIPLDAALPRTFISDLPGGFGHCMQQPEKTAPGNQSPLRHRADAERCLAPGERFPPYLVLLRVGFTLPPALPPERCALTAPFHPYPGAGDSRNGGRTRQAGPTRVLRFQGGPPAASEDAREG